MWVAPHSPHLGTGCFSSPLPLENPGWHGLCLTPGLHHSHPSPKAEAAKESTEEGEFWRDAEMKEKESQGQRTREAGQQGLLVPGASGVSCSSGKTDTEQECNQELAVM